MFLIKLSSSETLLFEVLITLYKRSQALSLFYREMIRVIGTAGQEQSQETDLRSPSLYRPNGGNRL